MAQEQSKTDIGTANKMKVMEMVTTIVAAAASNAQGVGYEEYYDTLLKTLYPTMVKLLADSGVKGLKIGGI